MTAQQVARLAVLTFLDKAPAHGYVLHHHLQGRDIGAPNLTPGTYRLLRDMESDGLVVGQWATPERGPARRDYSITDAGTDALSAGYHELFRHTCALRRLLADMPRQ